MTLKVRCVILSSESYHCMMELAAGRAQDRESPPAKYQRSTTEPTPPTIGPHWFKYSISRSFVYNYLIPFSV